MMPHQAGQLSRIENMSVADRRQADEQLGRLAKAVSDSVRGATRRARALIGRRPDSSWSTVTDAS